MLQTAADSESRRANPPVPAASNSEEAEYTELSDTEESERVVPAVQVAKQATGRPKVLGEAVHDPVDARGKTDFGIAAGEVLQLKYVDKEPPDGFHKFVKQIVTCKVYVMLRICYMKLCLVYEKLCCPEVSKPPK